VQQFALDISSSGSCSGSMSGYKKPAFQTSLTPVTSVRMCRMSRFFRVIHE